MHTRIIHTHTHNDMDLVFVCHTVIEMKTENTHTQYTNNKHTKLMNRVYI